MSRSRRSRSSSSSRSSGSGSGVWEPGWGGEVGGGGDDDDTVTQTPGSSRSCIDIGIGTELVEIRACIF